MILCSPNIIIVNVLTELIGTDHYQHLCNKEQTRNKTKFEVK